MTHKKTFKEVQAKWYGKLKKVGFEDIEDTKNPNRPLIEWHSLKWKSEGVKIRQKNAVEYQRRIEDFFNHPTFLGACESITQRRQGPGRPTRFTRDQVQKIWELHIQGLTTRKIAKELGRVKSRIDNVLKGLKSWMSLV